MAANAEELVEQSGEPAPYQADFHPLRVLPGGHRPDRTNWAQSAVLLGALGVLWSMRRGVGSEEGHEHISGTAAIVFVLYFLIVVALLRQLNAELSKRFPGSAAAEAVAYFVP